jgi:predicted nuclease of predicted toxin-antitoxin system
MKLLLDENLPHQLRNELPGHECFTVAYMGCAGVENGALLALAKSSGFDALLTKDANVEYKQNLVNLPIAVVILSAASNDIDDIRPLLPSLSEELANLPPSQITRVPKTTGS